MKQNIVIVLALGILSSHFASAKSNTASNSLDKTGVVQRYLLNPEGDVEGLLLEDGTQIGFPPHLSTELTAIIAPKDKVEIKGFRENAKVFKAESIKNLKTAKVVVDVPAEPPVGRPDEEVRPLPPPPPPHHHPEGPKGDLGGPGRPHEGLQQLTAEGTIQSQLFGRRGEVNGVVLSDGTIVRFGPRVLNESQVKVDIGQTIRVSGFGTKNERGQALEATELKN